MGRERGSVKGDVTPCQCFLFPVMETSMIIWGISALHCCLQKMKQFSHWAVHNISTSRMQKIRTQQKDNLPTKATLFKITDLLWPRKVWHTNKSKVELHRAWLSIRVWIKLLLLLPLTVTSQRLKIVGLSSVLHNILSASFFWFQMGLCYMSLYHHDKKGYRWIKTNEMLWCVSDLETVPQDVTFHFSFCSWHSFSKRGSRDWCSPTASQRFFQTYTIVSLLVALQRVFMDRACWLCVVWEGEGICSRTLWSVLFHVLNSCMW